MLELCKREEPREIAAPGAREMMDALHAARQEIAQLADGQARMMSVLLAQQEELSRLRRAMTSVRVTRAQELALGEAIRKRARELARQEGMPEAAARRIGQAIRVTLRETSGARAMGDLQAGQYDAAMQMIGTWRMAGALRRIRKEVQEDDD